MTNHEQIPLLARLEVSYTCDGCRANISLGTFYDAIDGVILASVKKGKMLCGMCRDKPLGSKE